MGNATQEQETVELDDLVEEAAETPLTPEAIVHLRAAGREVSESYGDIHALLDTVERALSEPTGGEKTLSEEERMNLARLVGQARDEARAMQEAVFERGRGERSNAEIEDGDAEPAQDCTDREELEKAVRALAFAEARILLTAEAKRERAERSAIEIEGLRHEIEDRVGIEGEESDQIVAEARDRAAERMEG